VLSHQVPEFLRDGAFLRYGDKVYVLFGGFHEPQPNHDESVLYIPNFFIDQNLNSSFGAQHFTQMLTQDFRNLIGDFLKDKIVDLNFAWQEPLMQDYSVCFESIETAMSNQHLDKAVPVLFAHAQKNISEVHKAQMIQSIFAAPQLFQYGWWAGDEGILGATPEVLVNIFKGELTSMALAGTEAKKPGVASTLMNHPKERHEHDLVVQDIVSVLKTFGEPKSRGPFLAELPTLWHLKTEIKMQLKNKIDSLKLIKLLHPTPALGVSPRKFGYEWLKNLPEANLRRKFGAPFALLLPNGDLVSLVAIRNIQWQDGHVILGAGGGVVKGSQLESEFEELKIKRASVRKLMGI
jgi:isochorismate synthase EntC